MTRAPEDLLEALGRVPIPAESGEQASARRERVLQHLEQLEQRLAARTRTRGRRLRLAGASLAFAGGAAAALGLPQLRAVMQPVDVSLELVSGRIETGPQGLRPSDGGFQMSVGQKLRVTSARARLDVERNATLDLAAATELSFTGVSGRRVLELHRGSVHLTVEELGAGHSLAVRTTDATVTVHGTRFSVTASAAEGQACTIVDLEQGVVSVDSRGRHALLTAPSSWSSCLARPKAASAAPAPLAPAHTAEVRPEQAAPEVKPAPAPGFHAPTDAVRHSTPDPASKAAAASTLGEENLLLASARKAALGGDDVKAIAHLERLLQLYPRSILAQNASVERFRALGRLGRHGDARKAATRYLSEYPDGFAQDEARALLSRAP
jgi:ferric-dicitrate binding protein FerR (iron transport regulator)